MCSYLFSCYVMYTSIKKSFIYFSKLVPLISKSTSNIMKNVFQKCLNFNVFPSLIQTELTMYNMQQINIQAPEIVCVIFCLYSTQSLKTPAMELDQFMARTYTVSSVYVENSQYIHNTDTVHTIHTRYRHWISGREEHG